MCTWVCCVHLCIHAWVISCMHGLQKHGPGKYVNMWICQSVFVQVNVCMFQCMPDISAIYTYVYTYTPAYVRVASVVGLDSVSVYAYVSSELERDIEETAYVCALFRIVWSYIQLCCSLEVYICMCMYMQGLSCGKGMWSRSCICICTCICMCACGALWHEHKHVHWI